MKYVWILLLASTAFAQCPVSVQKFSPLIGHEGRVIINFTNESDKTIVGLEFFVWEYDALDKSHLVSSLMDKIKLQPGQKKRWEWYGRFPLYSQARTRRGYELEVSRILYEDGSRFSNVDPALCRTKSKGRD